MNWNNQLSFFTLLTVLLQCTNPNMQEDRGSEIVLSHDTKYLIDAEELAKIVDADSIKIIDMRSPEAYLKGHIFNAIHLWREDIQNDSLPYTGMKASKEQMEELFRRKGIKTSDFLVVYDDKSSCEATRLWWVLGQYGFEKMAILHGGIHSWRKYYPLSKEIPEYPNSDFEFKGSTNKDMLITIDELQELQDSEVLVIDARSSAEYRGEYQKNGAYNRGRIPGSININWVHSVNTEDQTFKSNRELNTIYRELDRQVVVYCHSGVRSAHTLFVLTELLGKKNIKNFDGSWVEWSYYGMPLERDSTSTIN